MFVQVLPQITIISNIVMFKPRWKTVIGGDKQYETFRAHVFEKKTKTLIYLHIHKPIFFKMLQYC